MTEQSMPAVLASPATAPAAGAEPGTSLPWWARGTIYQIYPRSFADADGDGVGDLPGITARLDYLASLGIEAIWLSPIYPSPMVDFGYDVSDYRDIDPLFGSLADLDALVAGAHERGLRVILDWVANHTSDQHPWFVESRSSRDNPKRDWFVWSDPAPDGGPPNDWVSTFTNVGSAWTLDEATGQYYLHSFAREQPDLNWDNPEVEAAMHDVLRFWLERGVDGFRLDAIIKVAKDPLLRDHLGQDRRRDEDWDGIHDRIRGIRQVVDEYPDRMVVAELWTMHLDRFVAYLNTGDQFHLAHNFVFIDLPWDAGLFRAHVERFADMTTDDAWPCWFLENHDLSRVATRYDVPDEVGRPLGPARARAALVLLHALRGTAFLYQGQELGLPDADIPPERVVDVAGIRDPERAPIPWRRPSVAGPGAGFTTGEPWLPVVAAAESLCVEAQDGDPRSTLSLARRVLALRAATPALQVGTERFVEADAHVLAWVREHDGERWLAAVNFAVGRRPLDLAEEGPARGVVVLSSDADRQVGDGAGDGADEGATELASLTLAPAEAVLVRLV